jgi:hypothetical protein
VKLINFFLMREIKLVAIFNKIVPSNWVEF